MTHKPLLGVCLPVVGTRRLIDLFLMHPREEHMASQSLGMPYWVGLTSLRSASPALPDVSLSTLLAVMEVLVWKDLLSFLSLSFCTCWVLLTAHIRVWLFWQPHVQSIVTKETHELPHFANNAGHFLLKCLHCLYFFGIHTVPIFRNYVAHIADFPLEYIAFPWP